MQEVDRDKDGVKTYGYSDVAICVKAHNNSGDGISCVELRAFVSQ